MNRTRTVALVLAAAAAALAPALSGGAATAADGASYLQDPSGGEGKMKSLWTKDDMHKVEAQFRFHPGIQYKTITRPGPKGAEEYERKVGDPTTLAWEPGYEFAWSVSDSQGVKKLLTTKDGKQVFVLRAVLRDARRAEVAQVRQDLKDRPATGRTKIAGGKRITCDTGKYTVDWSVTRTGYGTLTGSLQWDSSCEQYRTAFTPKNQGAS